MQMVVNRHSLAAKCLFSYMYCIVLYLEANNIHEKFFPIMNDLYIAEKRNTVQEKGNTVHVVRINGSFL